MSQSLSKGFTAYMMERVVVVSAVMQMCHKYGGSIGALDSRTVSFPICTGVFNPAFTEDNNVEEEEWWNTNSKDIIKMMKAINKREKGNSVFSLLLDEIRNYGDDINMDLMMDVLHQGPNTRSSKRSEYIAHMNWKYPRKQDRAELHEAKLKVARACGRIIHRDFEDNFIILQNPKHVAESIR